ncbi:MAG: hypothetical protein Q9207_006274 [Kuettlingeria erythrocarpa]
MKNPNAFKARRLWETIIFLMLCISNNNFLLCALPSTVNAATPAVVSDDTFNNSLREEVDPPHGFTCSIRPLGPGRPVLSKDLYDATLHALLHYSLHSYLAPAERYTTRGSEPAREVIVDALPLPLPVGSTYNAHIVWGLYRSVIAYNMPSNVRETRASIFISEFPAGRIDYTLLPLAPIVAKENPRKANTALTSVSAMQMLSTLGDSSRGVPIDAGGYSLRFVLIGGGAAIRRETAYDAIAYAILYTAQFDESSIFTGTRILSVPGGDVVVRFVSYQVGERKPMTLGFAATITKSIPMALENSGRFQEAYVLVTAAEGQTCGVIGLWKREVPQTGIASVSSVNSTALEESHVVTSKQRPS